MQEIALNDEDVETLLNLLEANENAIEKGDALRWTPKAAELFGELREEIAEQIN